MTFIRCLKNFFHVSCHSKGAEGLSVLVSRSSGLVSSPGRGHCVTCSWARHCTLTVPLSTQVYKWVLVNLKGLGHAILGNFSTDQMVIELTKI